MNRVIHHKNLVKDIFESPTAIQNSDENKSPIDFKMDKKKDICSVKKTPDKICLVIDDSLESTPVPFNDMTNKSQDDTREFVVKDSFEGSFYENDNSERFLGDFKVAMNTKEEKSSDYELTENKYTKDYSDNESDVELEFSTKLNCNNTKNKENDLVELEPSNYKNEVVKNSDEEPDTDNDSDEEPDTDNDSDEEPDTDNDSDEEPDTDNDSDEENDLSQGVKNSLASKLKRIDDHLEVESEEKLENIYRLNDSDLVSKFGQRDCAQQQKEALSNQEEIESFCVKETKKNQLKFYEADQDSVEILFEKSSEMSNKNVSLELPDSLIPGMTEYRGDKMIVDQVDTSQFANTEDLSIICQKPKNKKYILNSSESVTSENDGEIIVESFDDQSNSSTNYRRQPSYITNVDNRSKNCSESHSPLADNSDSYLRSPAFSSTILHSKTETFGRHSIANDSVESINNNKESISQEIIEISDTESPQKTRQQTISGFLERKTETRQRQDINDLDDIYKRIKTKLELNEQPRQMKFLDSQNAEIRHKISALDNRKLSVAAERGSTQQVTNRNFNYEEMLKTLSENMLEVFEDKPLAEQDFSNVCKPKGLKVNLLPHQNYSMLWLKWREESYPHGSILADDMGLGKTLTVLSYLKMKKDEREEAMSKKFSKAEEDKVEIDDELAREGLNPQGNLETVKRKKHASKRDDRCVKRLKTLVVLPASLLHQWQGEIQSKFEKDCFKIHIYHESDRKKRCYNMDDNDIVFTTYEIVSREINLADKAGNEIQSDSPLVKIKWKRIILDEAHRIKNHTTKVNKAICSLKAKYRIAITGTPIHNSLNDLYSLVKFLHFEPLDNFSLWKYIFASEKFTTTANQVPTANSLERTKRLENWTTFLSDYLMLRRTKQDKFKGTEKKIVDLPEKRIEVIKFALGNKEKIIYDQIFEESKEKVNDFLKNQRNRLLGKKTQENVSNYSEIFVYLLRLRQACCHMSLLAECLDIDELQNQKCETEGIESMMENLKIDPAALKTESNNSINDKLESVDLIQQNKDLTSCLESSFKSSKLDKLIKIVMETLEKYPEDKLIVVSQWTGVLRIVAENLKLLGVEYCEIKGDVKLIERNEIVIEFNKKENTYLRVMLLSLTAGGVGLNLVGANRMFLLDIHWNPALEQQCGDRIYRVGQKKPVTIYKFLCENTIEERIETIQKQKTELAMKVYGENTTGPTNAKLSAKDFKLLFTGFETSQSID